MCEKLEAHLLYTRVKLDLSSIIGYINSVYLLFIHLCRLHTPKCFIIELDMSDIFIYAQNYPFSRVFTAYSFISSNFFNK